MELASELSLRGLGKVIIKDHICQEDVVFRTRNPLHQCNSRSKHTTSLLRNSTLGLAQVKRLASQFDLGISRNRPSMRRVPLTSHLSKAPVRCIVRQLRFLASSLCKNVRKESLSRQSRVSVVPSCDHWSAEWYNTARHKRS
jgi:hypothetical protein